MRLMISVPRAFVIMPFSADFAEIYEQGIKKACDYAGIECERVDEQRFTGNIVQRVLDEIARADLIIAEMTGRNANVFYEAGYAKALQKPIIFLSQDKEFPFDVGQDVHIRYSGDSSQLCEKLTPQVATAITLFSRAQMVPTQSDLILINKQSGKSLDVDLSSTPNSRIHQWQFHGGENQLWRLIPSSDGYFRIMSVGSRKCLGADGSVAGELVQVTQADYEALISQQWTVRSLRDGTHLFTNRTGGCLSIEYPASGDGATAVLRDGRAASTERWWVLVAVTTDESN